MTIRRALISVYDKTGVVEFARALHEEFGVEILSTGGTAKLLKDNGIPVTLVEDVTGFPEMLDGRVKTLHPKIFAGILADRDNPEHMRQLEAMGVKPIDLVVVNLYPFEKTVADPNCTFEQAIEMIDIGGVALLRAAAKNHKHVLVPGCVEDFKALLVWMRGDELSDFGWEQIRRDYAHNAYMQTCEYDAAITTWLSAADTPDGKPTFRFLRLLDWGPLRYGENAHQSSELLHDSQRGHPIDLTVADCLLNDGVEFSYNNYLDADAALRLCAELTRAGRRPACVFVKHNNPCGAGVGGEKLEVYRRAYLGDPNAAMGGILAVNFEVDAEFAAAVMETFDRFGKPLKESGASNAPGGFFLEVWVAPGFTDDAVQVIRTRKPWGARVRLLVVGDMNAAPDPAGLEYRSITGGMLVQTPDLVGLNEERWKVVTKRAPTESEMSDLRLAWLIAKHTKSNAISLVRDGMLIGNGAGQMSRVMSCRIAVWLARENGHLEGGTKGQRDKGTEERNHERTGAQEPAASGTRGPFAQAEARGSDGRLAEPPHLVAASDAFFPFRDGPDLLMDAGVTAIIQPGGSKRDAEVIAACDERGAAMIFTGTRHFRH
ncbi:MAG: Bifunctional purine biosynthesis protein PurH [Phycisphaerae bacterium]|nr:Bifunctional purine biosynthesis protein PurH [Phycisphaerae bacterium]